MTTLIFVLGVTWYLFAIALWFYIVYHQGKYVVEYQENIEAIKENIVEIQNVMSKRPLTPTEVKSLTAVICRLEQFLDNSSHT